ncbi:MAG: DUF262 domain-containing protein, partial [Rhodoglobus sp.]
ISTILDEVEMRRISLPEFQRGYVWTREDVRRLMESLYQGYPVGGLLTWTTESDRTATRGTSSGPVVELLLDGQQRVTSLYGVIRGKAPEFFSGNEQAFTGLYFNARSEVFEFYGPVKMKNDPLWVSVTELYTRSLEDLVVLNQSLSSEPGDQARYLGRLTRLRSITDRELHVEPITGRDRTIEEVVDIFNRVNSGGTKLSAGDLALARICAEWPAARSEMQQALTEWSRRGFEFKKDWLLRCVTSVATGQASFSALRGVSVDDFAAALATARRSVNSLLNLFADRLGLDHDRVLAGPYAMTALVRLVADRGGELTELADQQRVLYWYIQSFIWGRYSGSTETVLQRDLDAIASAGVDGLITELQRWRSSLEVRADDFDAMGRGSRFYPLLYLLTRTSQARDFGTGVALRADLLGRESSLHLHHIFPKGLLKAAGYGRGHVNAVANFCFLTARTNVAISDNPPNLYMPLVQDKHPGTLESQWVPTHPNLWEVPAYDAFLRARRELLAQAANELLSSLLGAAATLGGLTTEGEPTDQIPGGTIAEIVALSQRLGLPSPVVDYEIVDLDSGEVLAMADLAWPEGPLGGARTQPVAFLVERDELVEARLGELGYQFFTDQVRLVHHLEALLGADIDGDGEIGASD